MNEWQHLYEAGEHSMDGQTVLLKVDAAQLSSAAGVALLRTAVNAHL